MASTETSDRLCIYCRALEPLTEPCPFLKGRGHSTNGDSLGTHVSISGLTPKDAKLIQTLQAQPSALCTTCSRYNILHLLTKSEPLDHDQRRERGSWYPGTGQSLIHWTHERAALGPRSSLVLNPSCQLCRMLYCILPRNFEPEHDESDLYLEPYRTYVRHDGWEIIPEDLKKQYAVMLGIIGITGDISGFDSSLFRSASMTGPSIALEMDFAASDRRLLSGKPIECMLDLSMLRQALDVCLESHGDDCRTTKPASLLTTLMIDIHHRTVIPYSEGTDYVALSYVWGGVQASHKALANGRLPQTIEDAITVTKALGLRYLWVCYISSCLECHLSNP
jgi:hypothetical protein